MTFQQLEYLLEVYHTASISKAAKKLYVSPSAISIAINSLEEELGYPIFVRSAQGVLPTQKGKLVIEYAGRISESHRLMETIGANTRRPVRISSTDYPACSDAFVRLVQEHGGTNTAFSLEKYTKEEMLQKLTICQLDCGILFDFEPFIRALEIELEAKQLSWRVHTSVPACILLGPGHPLYEKEDVTLRDLESHIIIENRNRKVTSNRFLRGIINIPPEHILIADDKECRFKLVGQGLGFSLSRKPSGDVIQKYGLRCIPVESIQQQVISVTNPLQPAAPEVERFLELLDLELAEQV